MKNQFLSFLGPLLVIACAAHPPPPAAPNASSASAAMDPHTTSSPATTSPPPVATDTTRATEAAERPASDTKFAIPGPSATPDNSGANPPDGNAPTDQGSVADRKITQDVRRALMDDPKLASAAKNVKITTNNGKVTLRGPVKSEAARAAVETAAKKIAGAGQVENLLVVSE